MSLDVYLSAVRKTEVFTANITHNLTAMADAAGIYLHCWHPDRLNIQFAGDLIEPLKKGIALMEAEPSRFKAFDSPNGWGTYDDFLPWLRKYLIACQENPDAEVSTST